jgi:glycosyltransferase involved in cell wall biosynthesis
MKRKILVWDIENAGVGKFRFRDPHICLAREHQEDFDVDIIENPPIQNKDFISKYSILVLQASLLINEVLFKQLEDLKKNGLKVVLDLDDYWRLPVHHPLYRRMENDWKVMVSRFNVADVILTTTTNLAKEIAVYNKNVKIVPNAVNTREGQFTPQPIPSKRVRIGWAGGSSHLQDLKELRGLVNKFYASSKDEVQFLMAGFNNEVKDVVNGQVTTVKRPEVWMQAEMVFTYNYNNLDENYVHYLLNPRDGEYPGCDDKFYKRIWTKPIHEYATVYNEFDIALAPLEVTKFNSMKSQLKLIEAGFHKKPLIASQVFPYQIDGIHGKNIFLVEDKKAHKDWFKYAKMLVGSEQMRIDMGEALYETVKDKYNLSNVTQKRAQIYKSL